jgi:5-formyltetrahydrofolate cyclo-ligase
MTIIEEKKAFRKQILNKVSLLSAGEIRQKSLDISANLQGLNEWLESTVVFIFLSFEGEVETGPIMEAAEKAGKKLAAPCISGNDLFFRAFSVSQVDSLPRDSFGIREPYPQSELYIPSSFPEEKFLLLVPGIGFDKGKNRLGHGKGFYDRYIRTLRAGGTANFILAGICFEEQVQGAIPVTESDQRMDLVITDVRIIG